MNIIAEENPTTRNKAAANFNQKIASLSLNWLRGDQYYEREALYNIKVEVLSNPDTLFKTDNRITTDKCGASVTNFALS